MKNLSAGGVVKSAEIFKNLFSVKILLLLGFVGSIYYYMSPQSFTKGFYYIIFISLGFLLARYLKYFENLKNKDETPQAIIRILKYFYPISVITAILVLTFIFFIVPIGSVYNTFVTRGLALSDITITANIFVESAGVITGVPPAYADPLGQTWIVSLVLQAVLLLAILTILTQRIAHKKTSLKILHVNYFLTLLSFGYYLTSALVAGDLISYSSSMYSNISVLSLYWFIGLGTIFYTHLHDKPISKKQKIFYIVALVLIATASYATGYLNVSYHAIVIGVSALVLATPPLEIREEKWIYSKLNAIFEYFFSRLYYIFLALFPLLAFSQGLSPTKDLALYVVVLTITLVVAELLYRLNKFMVNNKIMNGTTLRSSVTLLLVFVGSFTMLAFVFTGNNLVKAQPNSLLATIIFSEKCNSGRLDSNPLKYFQAYKPEIDLRCDFPVDNSTKKLAILGDSNALSILDGLVKAGSETGWSVDSYGHPNCIVSLPSNFIENTNTFKESNQTCKKILTEALENIEAGEYDAVMLSSPVRSIEMIKGTIEFKNIVQELGIPVIIVDYMNGGDFYSGKNTVFINPWGDDRSIIKKGDNILLNKALVAKVLENTTKLNIREKFCMTLNDILQSSCRVSEGGLENFADPGHLTKRASEDISPIIVEILQNIKLKNKVQ